ncbi:MAG: GNAT family N-acetyltransferase [Chloroflexota bacterium]
MNLISEIEQIALETWPAEEMVDCDGWVLRASRGTTSRANSVWPNQDNGRLSLTQKIEAAESFYQSRNLTVKFQVNPISKPVNLAQTLLAKGYKAVGHVVVQTAVISSRQPPINPQLLFIHSDRLTAGWLKFHQDGNQYSEEETAVRGGIMRRITTPVVYLEAELNGETVGIGSAILMNGWLGILNMRTADAVKRQGVGTAVLTKLLQWGQQKGATKTFLQVVAKNQPAQALYRQFGYETVYGYHYLVAGD